MKEILSLDSAEVEQATQTDDHPVVRLEVNDNLVWARVAELEHDAYGGAIWYVEMTRLPKGEIVAMDVPLHILRKSARLRYHDMIVEQLQSVRIEGPVEWIPEFLTVDARRLGASESILVADLTMPSCCEPIDVAPDTPVVSAVRDTQKETARTTAGHATRRNRVPTSRGG